MPEPIIKPSPSGCICDGGSFEVLRYPFIVHPECAVHGSKDVES